MSIQLATQARLIVHMLVTEMSVIIVFCTIVLPIIPTRTLSIFEMMETVGIPDNDFSCFHFGNELDSTVAVTTCSKVLDNPDGCSRRCV